MIFKPEYSVQYVSSHFKQVIKVIGVGGGGSNAVNHMIQSGFEDVGYVVCNTDSQALEKIDDKARKLQLGIQLTKGLGAGTNPEIGEKAALESEQAIRELLSDKTEMVFITAGMGGGTGTGAAPVIAKIAKEMGLLVVAVVSDPFKFEGQQKIKQAMDGIARLRQHADTVLVVKNQLLQSLYKDLTIKAAYKKADEVLSNGVKSIADLITSPGEINCDFADVKMVLQNAGQAMMGSATVSGDSRAIVAIRQALESPLLENNSILGAKRILLAIAYSDEKPEYELKMEDQSIITEFIQDEISGEAEIFKHGFTIDRTLKDNVRVTIVAAGFNGDSSSVVILTTETQGDVTLTTEKTVVANPVLPVSQKQKQCDDLLDYFLKNDYRKQSLTDIPTFKRLGVQPVHRRQLPDASVVLLPLNELFDIMNKEGLIRKLNLNN